MLRVPIKSSRKSYLFQEELRMILDELVAKQSMPSVGDKVVRIENVFKPNITPAFVQNGDHFDVKCILDMITDYCGVEDAVRTYIFPQV